MDFLDSIFFENTLTSWLIALLASLLTWIVLHVAKPLILRRLASFARSTETETDDLVADLIKQTKAFLILVLSIYVGSLVLFIPPEVRQPIRSVAVIALLLQIGFWSDKLIVYWISYIIEERQDEAERTTTLSAFGLIAKIVVWGVIALLIMDNIPGVDVGTLIAGLGVVGIAVALAAQNILSDLFASLSIILDKPFVIGDYVAVDDYQGEIENIGLKTTRVRSLTGEEMVFSNSDLLSSRIRNYKSMTRRRVKLNIGITFQTPYEQVASIPDIIQEMVEAHDEATFGYTYFKEYGASSLNFETVYHVETGDFNVFKDIQQSINLDLYKRFEEEGIKFAYPTQTVHVER